MRCVLSILLLASSLPAHAQGAKRMTLPEKIQAVLDATQPLDHPRGDRLPIRAMGLEGLPAETDAEIKQILTALESRGIALSARWTPGDVEKALEPAMRLSRLQRELGLEIGVNANACIHRFCNGDESTAHIDADGNPFFDDTFGGRKDMGCPFALKHRYPAIKEQLEAYLRPYKEAGLQVDFIYLDWEIDGPIEWNGGWAHSKRCTRCRENVPDIDDFTSFQTALRTLRAEMQREVFSETVKAYFPDALMGNYAVYPHNGERYWYDYFEEFVEGAPHRVDGRAKYRKWFPEFEPSGFTFAMPVVYTWYPTFAWYDFEDPDYRWFYNMLLVATNACEHTPASVPVISWLHWHTTAPAEEPDPAVKQMSENAYRELIWHMLLRGTDGLMNWCMAEETGKELALIQQVYAASLEYRRFLDGGEPVSFTVPAEPAPVVSGLLLGDELLVRRTDFGDGVVDVTLQLPGGGMISVPPGPGRCQVIRLDAGK